MNHSIRIDLLKLGGAFVARIKGKTETRACVCVPIDEAGLFLGEKGCYLNLKAIELKERKFDDTHCVKVSVNKDEYEAMSEEARRDIPILGGMRPMESERQTLPVTNTVETEGETDLPF